MSGYVGDLSEKQEAALVKFKENLADVLQEHHDDRYLLRWLRARWWDLGKAEKMLRDSLIWRKQSGADTILETFEVPMVLQKYYPGGIYGHDKIGHPIYIENFGYADTKGILHSVKKSDIIKFKICACERIQRAIKENSDKFGYDVKGYIVLFDMDKYGMKHIWKPAFDIYSEVLRIFEANYPETSYRTYIVNAPRIFPILYNLIKGVLSEDTKKKVVILGSNWRQHLLEEIDADQLPVHWGGTATDPDGNEMCKSHIGEGGEVPKENYLNAEEFVDLSTFTKATVGKGSSLQLDYEVKAMGSIISWQFLTQGKDIGFGIFLRTTEGAKRQSASAMKEVLPSMRVNSHMVPEDGTFTCEDIGTYVLRFDNTYSWMTAKKLMYTIEVLQPGSYAEIHRTESYANSQAMLENSATVND